MEWLALDDHRTLTPNRYTADDPRSWAVKPVQAVVLHYTGGYSAGSSVRWLADPAAKASAHFVVGRSGELWQLAPLSDRCWHAGSRAPGAGWRGQPANAISIGIEIANLGLLHRVEGGWIDGWGKRYAGEVAANVLPLVAGDLCTAEIRRLRTELGLVTPDDTAGEAYDGIAWDAYPAAQLEAVERLVLQLIEQFPVLSLFDEGTPRICGHSDVDPTRKIDPGPAYPLQALRDAVALANLGECEP